MRVDLRDDELRDVKELREPVQRQVRPQRAVHVLGARRVHRHDAAAAVFRHQGRRPHDARQRARGCDGGVDEHVWRGDVVQQDGLAFAAPAARRRGDRDVDVPPRAAEALLEGHVAVVGAGGALEVGGLDEVAVLHKGEDLLVQRREPSLGQASRDGRHAHVGQHLFVGALCEEAGDDRAAGGAADHAREEALLEEGLDHTHVVHGERAAAREAERGVADRQLGRSQEREPLLELRHRRGGKPLGRRLDEPPQRRAQVVRVPLRHVPRSPHRDCRLGVGRPLHQRLQRKHERLPAGAALPRRAAQLLLVLVDRLPPRVILAPARRA
mmetsp:Transcript_16444/g.53242  ORF Transcript_16444/g.53242 Transcript_16444/m.53242 type:complete len:326 (-) Transcript_16444:701-1678(-)